MASSEPDGLQKRGGTYEKISSILIGLSIIVFLFFFLAVSPANAQVSKKYELRWGTIVAGGAWQIIGSAMLEDVKKANPNITGSTVPSTPTQTLMAITPGKIQYRLQPYRCDSHGLGGGRLLQAHGADQEHPGPRSPLSAGNTYRGPGRVRHHENRAA